MGAADLTLNGWDIFKLALSTGVVTAIINQGISWFRDYKKDKIANSRIASYSALRLAVDLETYAIACSDAISDIELFKSSGGYAGKEHTNIPILAKFPDDIDWKMILPSESARVLTFINELVIAQKAINFCYEVNSDCVPYECNNQMGICGYRAWLIASDLRKQYKFPAFTPEKISWDIEKFLKTHHDLAIEKKQKEESL